MTKKIFSFSSGKVNCYFDASFENAEKIFSRDNSILVTDEHIYAKHKGKFKNRKTIILQPGEQNKIQSTVDSIIRQ